MYFLQDGKRGKAYGVLTWRGEQQGEQPTRINGASKKLWRPLGAAAAGSVAGEAASPVWQSLAASALAESEAQEQGQEEQQEPAVENVEEASKTDEAPPS